MEKLQITYVFSRFDLEYYFRVCRPHEKNKWLKRKEKKTKQNKAKQKQTNKQTNKQKTKTYPIIVFCTYIYNGIIYLI